MPIPGGYHYDIQDAIAEATSIIHQAGGYSVQYHLVTDRTVQPIIRSIYDTFLEPTPTSRSRQILGGRYLEAFDGLDQFIISRNDLVVGGIHYEPTTMDFFIPYQADGTLGTFKYWVKAIVPLAGVPSEYYLGCSAQMFASAKG